MNKVYKVIVLKQEDACKIWDRIDYDLYIGVDIDFQYWTASYNPSAKKDVIVGKTTNYKIQEDCTANVGSSWEIVRKWIANNKNLFFPEPKNKFNRWENLEL